MLKEASACLEKKLEGLNPSIGLVLGSGMGKIAENIEDALVIPYSDIPGFPSSTVKGHSGKLIAGKWQGKAVLVMQGRVHFYEGYPMSRLAFPFRLMKKVGIQHLLLSNAVGSVNQAFQPGDLMLVKDLINFGFSNPLIGPVNEDTGPRFFNNALLFDPSLRQIAFQSAGQLGLSLRPGNLIFMTGPSYETPAEVEMCRFFGADAVGMSVLPEAMAAANLGIKVLAVSAVSNMGAGLEDEILSHEEVIERMGAAGDKLAALFAGVIKQIP